jgi:hypothetical protein
VNTVKSRILESGFCPISRIQQFCIEGLGTQYRTYTCSYI